MQPDKSDHDLLVEIHTHVVTLMGNGQPGLIKEIQNRLHSLEKWRYLVTGGWTLLILLTELVIHWKAL